MSTARLIERKRDGGKLSVDEIGWLIRHYTDGDIPDYQMSALLMAILFRGLDRDELYAWVDAMLTSGDRLDLSGIDLPRSDKHSTGGVGDKVSIPLGPMVAACGVAVPMISGRGLGHTGGTLDKLESIPGLKTQFDHGELDAILAAHGLAFAGQSKSLAPADRKLYALRDTTGTIPSIPLIASSIMSKKLAENLDSLVLDVKVGSGSFMKDTDRARQLARTLVDIGERYGVRTMALLTGMHTPLGQEVGNASEIRESIEMLKGSGPDDLVELVFALGTEMLMLSGVARDGRDARRRLQAVLDSGAALETFARVVEAQGGNPDVIDRPSLLPVARHGTEFPAQASGIVSRCDALQVGLAAVALGAGRETMDDRVDPAVGITLLARPGDSVVSGQPLARIAWNDKNRLAECLTLLERAYAIGHEPVVAESIIIEEVRP